MADPHPKLDGPVELESGTCYLVKGKQTETSYRLLQDFVERGTPGLCITRTHPEKVRSRYSLDSGPVWWISYSPGRRHYAPPAVSLLAEFIDTITDDQPTGRVG